MPKIFNKTYSMFKNDLQKKLASLSPSAVLIFCLLITTAATVFTEELILREERSNFEKRARFISVAIENRMQVYKNFLLATRGLFISSNEVTRKEFKEFAANFNLIHDYPGIQGIGFTLRLNEKTVQKHINEIRRSGLPDYHIWPNPKNKDFFSIVFIEPLDWRNRRSLGFDMSSEAVRREAMEAARDTGKLTTSRRLILVQETEKDPQPGFLIYAPIYQKGKPLETIEDRKKYLVGFVYSPFRATDLFDQLNQELTNQRTNALFTVYDGLSEDKNNILFSSFPAAHSKKFLCRHETTITLFASEHPWTLKIQVPQDLQIQTWEYAAVFIAFFGIIISLLTYFTVRFARLLNQRLTEDLKRKQISEQEILRAQKSSEEANQAKSRFLAAVTHEIRTPLGIILGFSELALESKQVGPDAREFLFGIKRNVLQLTNLIGDVLDLSKIEANRLEIESRRFSLPETILDIMGSMGLLATEKGLTLHWVHDKPLPQFIYTDPLKFRQILINLIGNAIKFTDQGEVTLITQMLSEELLGVNLKLEFIIKDTGIGMDAEFKKKIFQPFSQAKSTVGKLVGGTGLGLILSKQLAQAIGGDVTLMQSEPEKGSTFRFILDAGKFEGTWDETQAVHRMSLDQDTSKNEKVLLGTKVLLAEDSTDNQLLLSRFLKSAGAEIEIANDGLEAIEKVEKNNFDLILMDIQMPNLNGFEATQRLRAGGYKKIIIALTAHAFQEERERILHGGFDHYLTKPISKKQLIEEIKMILKKQDNLKPI